MAGASGIAPEERGSVVREEAAGEESRDAVGRYLATRTMPPLPVRVTGRLGTRLIVSMPWLWRPLRRPTRAIWNRVARNWDEGINPDSPDHLAPLLAACDRIRAPRRILDLGTGTGAGALMLAHRFGDANVVGVDISDEMIERARDKRPQELGRRVEFAVADASSLPYAAETFDLITQLNMPPFCEEVARVLRPGGHVVIADSIGRKTPSYTSERTLRRAFDRRGLRVVASGRAGAGTFFIARRV
jgi:SAM-dependent methyltransferase